MQGPQTFQFKGHIIYLQIYTFLPAEKKSILWMKLKWMGMCFLVIFFVISMVWLGTKEKYDTYKKKCHV